MTLTGNRLVALHLRRFRKARDWTQEEAAQRYAEARGNDHRPVSNATWSFYERSVDSPTRVCNFSADDLHAFAQMFGVPISAFFDPDVSCPTCGQPLPKEREDG